MLNNRFPPVYSTKRFRIKSIFNVASIIILFALRNFFFYFQFYLSFSFFFSSIFSFSLSFSLSSFRCSTRTIRLADELLIVDFRNFPRSILSQLAHICAMTTKRTYVCLTHGIFRWLSSPIDTSFINVFYIHRREGEAAAES